MAPGPSFFMLFGTTASICVHEATQGKVTAFIIDSIDQPCVQIQVALLEVKRILLWWLFAALAFGRYGFGLHDEGLEELVS